MVEAQSFSVAEGSAEGTEVGTVDASDPDLPAQAITFEIVDGNDEGLFTIDPNTGIVTVAVENLPSFDTPPSYSLTVRATDNGEPALNDEAIITITVTDVTEPEPTGDAGLLAAAMGGGQSSGDQEPVDAVFGEEDPWYGPGWNETL